MMSCAVDIASELLIASGLRRVDICRGVWGVGRFKYETSEGLSVIRGEVWQKQREPPPMRKLEHRQEIQS